jgi:hypothetical protein
MAKLVAIGDSLTQGFQSGAILKTAWSFPALIARSMGLNVPLDFRVPRFPGSGLPLNIEELLRFMETELGVDLDLLEWNVRFPVLLNQFMDGVEDLYERGSGFQPAPFGGVYHNLGIWGFRVADSFQVSARYSESVMDGVEGSIADDFLGLPSAPMYRTARRVLNPGLRPGRMDWSQLDNLKQLVEEEGGVESLILWLGSNDALQTVTQLEIQDMPAVGVPDDPEGRRQWNLTNETIFADDFNRLVAEVKEIIPVETKVFVGTVGHVTIPPVTQGIPPYQDGYFEYYARFFQDKSNFVPLLHKPHLTRQDAIDIDGRIDDFNAVIREVVAQQGDNWHIVDTGGILDTLAVKRNELSDTPGRALKDYYAAQGITDHPLLHLSPIPSVLRFETIDKNRVSGGLIALDCIHPTTIGYGSVAEAFLKVMQSAGIPGADPARLNWAEIITQDSLIVSPPQLWDDILTAAQNHATLWNVIFNAIT